MHLFRDYSFSFLLTLSLHLVMLIPLTSKNSIHSEQKISLSTSLNVFMPNETNRLLAKMGVKNKQIDVSNTRLKNRKILAKKKNPTQQRSKFLSDLRYQIEKNKFYPLSAKTLGQQGAVKVAFDLLKSGKIRNIRIISSSHYPLLDNAAIETIQKLGNYKPIPKELEVSQINLIQKINYKN